jgi:hypothetical protein
MSNKVERDALICHYILQNVSVFVRRDFMPYQPVLNGLHTPSIIADLIHAIGVCDFCKGGLKD